LQKGISGAQVPKSATCVARKFTALGVSVAAHRVNTGDFAGGAAERGAAGAANPAGMSYAKVVGRWKQRVLHGPLGFFQVVSSFQSNRLVSCLCTAHEQRAALEWRQNNNQERKQNMNINYKVSYGFAQLPDTAIADYVDTIIAALTGNAAFPNLPVTLAALGTLKTDYLAKLAATAQGGTLATAEKNTAKAALVDALRKTAAYVQSVAGQDLSLLLSSGFQPVSTNRTQSPLEKPVVLDINNTTSTKLVLRLKPVANARAYEAQYKNGGGWLPAGIFTQARRIEIGNLTPGVVYTVQTRAIGGSTGYSEWSDPQSNIAT
jgi:hypothetical protein